MHKRTLTTLLMATLGLAISAFSAQARLGWTLDQCKQAWGEPIRQEPDPLTGTPGYLFRVEPDLYTRVFFLNGYVQDINYHSKNKTALLNDAQTILHKNYEGKWGIYDDGRGSQSVQSWQAFNLDGSAIVAYAIFWSAVDANGYYTLQVATQSWSKFAAQADQNKAADHPSNPSLLNISYIDSSAGDGVVQHSTREHPLV
jgi:hypothetical protein